MFEPIDFVIEIMTIILIIIALALGYRLLFKYGRIKDKNLLYMGICLILMTSIWWSTTISFLLILVTGSGLSFEIYYFTLIFPLPWALFFWLIVFIDLKNESKKKMVVEIYLIFVVVFNVVFITLLFTIPSLLGTLNERGFSIRYGLVSVVFILIMLSILLITAILFYLATVDSNKRRIRIKGKFIFIGFLLFIIGVLLDTLPFIFDILARIVEAFSVIFLYLGFNLPKRFN